MQGNRGAGMLILMVMVMLMVMVLLMYVLMVMMMMVMLMLMDSSVKQQSTSENGGRDCFIATHPSRTCTPNQPRALACAQRVQPMCTCTCGTASHACAVYRGASNLCCGRVRCNILQRDSGNAWVCGERSKAAQIRSIGKVATAYWLGANVA